MAWRRFRGLTQEALARRARLTRPFISNLECGDTDPALSSVQRIAGALDMEVGRLIDTLPAPKKLNRFQMDEWARAALRPGAKAARKVGQGRLLAKLIRDRREALGLYVPRKKRSQTRAGGDGQIASRWLRASLGETQWHALLKRIDKLAFIVERP